jgi:ABC-type lipoprotein export system ATPase subunit
MSEQEVMLELISANKIFNEGKDNEVKAVRDASLQIRKGEMVALMGPSGSGKSTLLNLIGGLAPITSGTIRVDGLDVGGMSEEERTAIRRDRIGFIFQHFNLLDFLTAKQNVMLPLLIQGIAPDVAERRSTMLLRELGLGGRLEHTPAELSGGQEQRVAISRSLITNPKIILGDEPTGDLDRASAEDVMKMFRRINKELGQTLLLVTHDPWIGSQCDRIIRIDDGMIIEEGGELK